MEAINLQVYHQIKTQTFSTFFKGQFKWKLSSNTRPGLTSKYYFPKSEQITCEIQVFEHCYSSSLWTVGQNFNSQDVTIVGLLYGTSSKAGALSSCRGWNFKWRQKNLGWFMCTFIKNYFQCLVVKVTFRPGPITSPTSLGLLFQLVTWKTWNFLWMTPFF